MMLRGSRTALFNADTLPGARVAVVVEGEFDALLLGQFLPDGWAAVTMGGAGSLPDERFLPYFGGIERVLLCLDADPAGRRGAGGLATAAGLGRTRAAAAGGSEGRDRALAAERRFAGVAGGVRIGPTPLQIPPPPQPCCQRLLLPTIRRLFGRRRYILRRARRRRRALSLWLPRHS